MFCFVVEQNTQEDDRCSEAGKERDRVAKYEDGEPNQQYTLGCVGNTAKVI